MKMTIKGIATTYDIPERYVASGDYDAESIRKWIHFPDDAHWLPDFLTLNKIIQKKIIDFCEKHPNWCLASRLPRIGGFAILSNQPSRANLTDRLPAKILWVERKF
jgi:hypothetical protein